MVKQCQAIFALLCVVIGPINGLGAIMPLDSPEQLNNPITLNFEGHPDYTPANTLYQSQGVLFTRDDGAPIYLSDWTALKRITTSPDNVLATIRKITEPVWATHLNVLPVEPVFAMAAYFGNDQAELDFTTIKMSAYGLDGNALGSIQVQANNNTHVDQFIGLSSDVPIAWVRFDNLNIAGTQSQSYSVVIDDLMFVPVPEPSTFVLTGLGLVIAGFAQHSRRRRQ